jgi:hypothetical protein
VNVRLGIAVLLAPAALGWLASASPASTSGLARPGEPVPDVAIVYVEGNVGGASGGHVALRAGDSAFHLQYVPGEFFRIMRDPWPVFDFEYGTLQNRPVHAAYLDAVPAERRRIADYMTARHLEQRRKLDALERAGADAALLEALLGEREGVSVRGAGLLDRAHAGDPFAAALRRGVEAHLGAGALAAHAAASGARLRAELEALSAGEAGAPEVLREGLAEAVALAALAGDFGLATDSWLVPEGSAPLKVEEREALAALSADLEARIAALVGSTRPDRGFALLVAAARAQALRRSLAEGRLVFLDPFPDDAPQLGLRAIRERRAELAALAARAGTLFEEARGEALAVGRLDEPAYNVLETLAARHVEYGRQDGVREVRARRLVPERGRVVALPFVAPGARALLAGRDEARAGEAALRADLASRFAYDLFGRNCVTELARMLAEVWEDEGAAVRALGGPVPGGEALGFIPFVFFSRVERDLRVARSERLDSYRERALAALYDAGPDAVVYVRESNVMTSRVYQRRARDGSFLLFTSDVFWPRPLYGAVNMAYGLGDGALGVLTAPFDRGSRVLSGWRGALFSVPELAFFNVRKGSFDAASLPE